MKNRFLAMIIACVFIGGVISCSNENDVPTNSGELNGINPKVEFQLKSAIVKISKGDKVGFNAAVSDLIDDAGSIMGDDKTIGEVRGQITDDDDYFYFHPLSTEPVVSPYLGKCPDGYTEVLGCNGINKDCQDNVAAAIEKQFTGLGRGSNVTVNVNVSTFGYVRVCVSGKK